MANPNVHVAGSDVLKIGLVGCGGRGNGAATQALNTAILGLPRRHGRVVATDWDHNAVLRPLARLADEQGVQVDVLPDHPLDDIDAL